MRTANLPRDARSVRRAEGSQGPVTAVAIGQCHAEEAQLSQQLVRNCGDIAFVPIHLPVTLHVDYGGFHIFTITQDVIS